MILKRFNPFLIKRERDFYRAEVAKLAYCIMNDFPGEPSRSEGVVDTAIRLIRSFRSVKLEIDEKDVLKYVPCMCDEAFKGRGLSDPICPFHSTADWKGLLEEVGVKVRGESNG